MESIIKDHVMKYFLNNVLVCCIWLRNKLYERLINWITVIKKMIIGHQTWTQEDEFTINTSKSRLGKYWSNQDVKNFLILTPT